MPSPLFQNFAPQDAMDLIAEYPLAWVVPADGRAPATLLPLIAEAGADGMPAALIGHFARRNPLVAALREAPEATILVTGPQAYVSPAMVSDPDWGPTWNYAALELRVQIDFEEERGAAAIGELLAHMEKSEPTGWTPDALGPRRDPMVAQIIAFRAQVLSLAGRFKLGQDEKPERLREMLARLSDRALVRWMRRFNAARLGD